MTFKGQYKCRLCGEIEENPVTSNEDLAMQTAIAAALDMPCKEPQRPTMYGVHNCRNGSYGISEFLGWRAYTKDMPNICLNCKGKLIPLMLPVSTANYHKKCCKNCGAIYSPE